MKIKCIVCGYEKEVDNGIYQKDIEAFHLSETGHQGWTTEFLEDEDSQLCIAFSYNEKPTTVLDGTVTADGLCFCIIMVAISRCYSVRPPFLLA